MYIKIIFNKKTFLDTGKKFVCNEEGCDYTTPYKQSLTRHIKTHTGEKPFTCNVEGCSYKSTTSSNLTRHNNETHMKGEKKFKCEVCKYETANSSHFNRHEKTHFKNDVLKEIFGDEKVSLLGLKEIVGDEKVSLLGIDEEFPKDLFESYTHFTPEKSKKRKAKKRR